MALYRAKAKGPANGVEPHKLTYHNPKALHALVQLGLAAFEIGNASDNTDVLYAYLNTRGWKEGYRQTRLYR